MWCGLTSRKLASYNLTMPTKLQEYKADPEASLVHRLDTVENTLFSEFDVLIAGGAVRKAFNGESLGKSDIDIFFKNDSDHLKAALHLKALGCKVRPHVNCHGVVITKENHPVGTNEGLYIQLIFKERYPTMVELLDGFDYTVCQFGYSKGVFYTTEKAVIHEEKKILSWNDKCTQQYNMTRYVKYLQLGYTPEVDLFRKVFVHNRESLLIASEEISDYDALYGAM
jgi:hypothetical protein